MASVTELTDARAAVPRDGRPGEFEYAFPSIRGVQAGREYYVTMCPLRLVSKLFVYNEEDIPAPMRAQRPLNKARVPEMARYVTDNPRSYVFSALTASVNAEARFEAIESTSGSANRLGTLSIPMSATFVINDGQHRRAAIQQALMEKPELADESIAIVLFIDAGLDRSQQMFADLNRHAVRPNKSIGVLYDHRDELSIIARSLVFSLPLFSDLTDTETGNLGSRSRKLFTLAGFYSATKALLDDIEPEAHERRRELAVEYWRAIIEQFPEWQQVYKREVTAGEVRQDFIHTHGIVLHALGKVGNELLRCSTEPANWEPTLRRLREIDWHRANAFWEGRATVAGAVSRGSANVILTTAAIRSALGMQLAPDELRAEEAFQRGENL